MRAFFFQKTQKAAASGRHPSPVAAKRRGDGTIRRTAQKWQSLWRLSILHRKTTVACPLCREKYGSTNGKYQEAEGAPMVEVFLMDMGLNAQQVERVKYFVWHHHTLTSIDGADHQILVEADYIVNASENGYSIQNVESFLSRTAKTDAGKRLIRSVLCH